MDSNLLKEAIADAKAVRQTALANAKAALEEAFGNRLEAMLTPKLEEETADLAPVPAAAPTAAAPLEQEAVVNETDIEQIIRELESELPKDGAAAVPTPAPMAPPMDPAASAVPPVPPVDSAAAAPVPPLAPAGAPTAAPAPMAPPLDTAAGAPPVPPSPQGEEDMDEMIDVNELLESLKREEEEEEMDENAKINEETKLNPSGIGGGKAGGSDNKEPSKGSSASSHLETAPALKSASSMPEGGKVTSHGDDATKTNRPNEGEHVTKTNQSTPGGALKEVASVKSGKVGFPDGHKTSSGDDATEGVDRPNEGEHATKTDQSTPGGALKEENTQLKAQLNETEQALTYLRGQLNEINLLNAKLLYTNRLFKEYSMDNGKKMKIVEMFDLAKNVREVKMTYAVIAESLNFGADFKRKEKTQSTKIQNITEGMASRPVAGTAPRQIIAEGAVSEMKAKFMKLANIKPSQPTTKK